MRDQNLLGIDEETCLKLSREYARKIDQFLIKRESSVLSKLVAIGGTSEEESFEIQLKVRIDDPEPLINKLNSYTNRGHSKKTLP